VLARLRLYLSLVLTDRLWLVALIVAVPVLVGGSSFLASEVFWRGLYEPLRTEARTVAGPDAATLGCYQTIPPPRAGGSAQFGGAVRCFFEVPGTASVLRAGKIDEVKGSMAPIKPEDTDVEFRDGRHHVTMSYSAAVTGDVIYGHRLDPGQTLIVVTVTDRPDAGDG
jgi:hypothetical protein